MKKKKIKELDVDFIGGEPPPTEEEFKMISAFLKAQKEKAQKVASKTKKPPKGDK